MTGSTEILDNKPDKNFLCGVVEGFYGIPWTSEQRKLLFKWMNSMGMTTYMYAPKDDAKHRAFWRELYSVEEADNLTSLIEAACENNVTFVYAISPGLDISFSNTKDVQCLKRKLEQVAAFGCHAFALLFDDIDPELSPSDKSVFQSSACAQVSITNEVFEYLGQPEFFFCPTEYCTSRCVPNLATSDYVNTVGSKLLNAIHILWTGSKVISKKLTIQELEEVAGVFRRPPVIWDNIHANDYDPRRLYLGPYDGRSPEIIPYLRGVLTNPNCEFEANYVPLHTLSQWSKSNKNGVKKDFASEIGLSPVISDIKLESECECNSDDDITPLDLKYQPKQALKTAIIDWLKEYFKDRHPPRTMAVARPAPMIPPLLGMPTNAVIIPNIPIYNEMPINNFPMLPTPTAVPPPFLNPQMPVLVNSLVDPLCSPQGSPERNRLDSDSESDISVSAEPMECVPSTITESLHVLESDSDLSKTSSSENIMQVEGPCLYSTQTAVNTSQLDKFITCVSHEDLDLFISFFYLPFEYASKPIQMLQDLHWLKVNSFLVANSHKDNAVQVAEWWAVSEKFLKQVNQLQTFANNLRHIPNQAVGFYFYPYLWDMLGVLQTCCGFVRWLGLGHLSNFVISQLQGPFTWLTKDYRDTFLSGDQEPWGFQGGLQAEFQRMLPIASAHDLLYIRHPDKILKKTITYRPYRASDQNDVYNICLKTCDDGMDGTEVFPENPNVICEKIIGAIVSLSPEFCFVAEDDEGVVGYCVATLDTRQLKQHWQMAWLPAMQEKYPKPERTTDLTPAEEVMLSFYGGESIDVPVAVSVPFPSVLRLDVLCNRLEDLAVTKRLLACTLSALKAKGSTGVHVELSVGDKCVMEHYRMLGFVPVKPADTLDHTVFLGRIL